MVREGEPNQLPGKTGQGRTLSSMSVQRGDAADHATQVSQAMAIIRDVENIFVTHQIVPVEIQGIDGPVGIVGA